jgi:hypothetical protein
LRTLALCRQIPSSCKGRRSARGRVVPPARFLCCRLTEYFHGPPRGRVKSKEALDEPDGTGKQSQRVATSQWEHRIGLSLPALRERARRVWVPFRLSHLRRPVLLRPSSKARPRPSEDPPGGLRPVTRARELDSLPLSEAPSRTGPEPREKTVDDWKFCAVHAVWFSFKCRFCERAILGFSF